jgi:hypothetical protein
MHPPNRPVRKCANVAAARHIVELDRTCPAEAARQLCPLSQMTQHSDMVLKLPETLTRTVILDLDDSGNPSRFNIGTRDNR